jgi:hypothetical protein
LQVPKIILSANFTSLFVSYVCVEGQIGLIYVTGVHGLLEIIVVISTHLCSTEYYSNVYKELVSGVGKCRVSNVPGILMFS